MSLTYIEGMVDARLRHYPQSIIDMFNAQPFFAFVGAPPLSFDQLNPDDKQILTALVDIFERGGAATDEL
jgi:hypothetical protein